jgi:putative SOS response-associated peptidase YedK
MVQTFPMCGRMVHILPHDAMAQLFRAAPANALPDVPNFNVCPTVQVAAVVARDNGRHYAPMRWGFIPHWYKAPNAGPLLINARAETIADKPAFKVACRARRCIVPVSGFYEWTRHADGTKLPWYIQRRDRAPMAMAAIWQDWGDLGATAALVTTSANAAMAKIHHRIPVILEENQYALWLGEEGHGAAPLMTATSEDTLSFHRVDKAVNSNRATGPDLIEPIET